MRAPLQARRLPAPLHAPDTELWLAPATAANATRLLGGLSADERRRAAAHRDAARRRAFIIGCGLLRWVLGRRLAVAPRDVPLLLRRRRRPRLQARRPGERHVLSVSHAGRAVLVAVLADPLRRVRIGADLEVAQRPLGPGARRKLTAAGSAADLGGWVRFEAALKADGRGLALADALQVTPRDARPWRFRSQRAPCLAGTVDRLDGLAALGYVGALAVIRLQDPMR